MKSTSNGFYAAKTTQSSFQPQPLESGQGAATATNFFTNHGNKRGSAEEQQAVASAEDSTELRERLFVAERVMRTLFERNKVLEQQQESTPARNCDECLILRAKVAQMD